MDPTAKVKNEDGTYNASASFSSTISNPNLMFGDVKDQGDRSETLDAELMRSLTNVEGELKLPYDLTLRSIFGFDYMSNSIREFWAPKSVMVRLRMVLVLVAYIQVRLLPLLQH